MPPDGLVIAGSAPTQPRIEMEVAAVGGGEAPPAVNLLSNPEMNTTITPWVAYGNATVTRETGRYHSSPASAKAVMPELGGYKGIISELITVTPSTGYGLEVWHYASRNQYCYLFIQECTAAGAVLRVKDVKTGYADTEWRHWQTTETLSSDAAKVRVGMRSYRPLADTSLWTDQWSFGLATPPASPPPEYPLLVYVGQEGTPALATVPPPPYAARSVKRAWSAILENYVSRVSVPGKLRFDLARRRVEWTPPNLIVNASFEQGLRYWTTPQYARASTDVVNQVYAGRAALSLSCKPVIKEAVSAPFAVTPDELLHGEARVVQTFSDCTGAKVGFRFYDVNGDTLSTAYGTSAIPLNTFPPRSYYRSRTVDAIVPANAVAAALVLDIQGSGASSQVLWDACQVSRPNEEGVVWQSLGGRVQKERWEDSEALLETKGLRPGSYVLTACEMQTPVVEATQVSGLVMDWHDAYW
jgi:hypothetical protein